ATGFTTSVTGRITGATRVVPGAGATGISGARSVGGTVIPGAGGAGGATGTTGAPRNPGANRTAGPTGRTGTPAGAAPTAPPRPGAHPDSTTAPARGGGF